MKRLLIVALSICSLATGRAQHYTSAHIFAHNDYERTRPFHTAYDLQVGFIEADVFLVDDELLVAHHKHEIKAGKTLESLYLKPLQDKISTNAGFVYAEHNANLTLMIDLKTEGAKTLEALVTQLTNYPDLLSCRTLRIMISGNVPDRGGWDHYPPYIYFDGRPGIPYTTEQLARVSMISTNFSSHVRWDGKNKMSDADRKKIADLVDEIHAKGKRIRFWGTPDFDNAWEEQIELNMDVIVTDKVEALAAFLNRKQ
jgi:alkaline phosphatase